MLIEHESYVIKSEKKLTIYKVNRHHINQMKIITENIRNSNKHSVEGDDLLNAFYIESLISFLFSTHLTIISVLKMSAAKWA